MHYGLTSLLSVTLLCGTLAQAAEAPPTPCAAESASIQESAKKLQGEFQSITDEGKAIEGDKGKAELSATVDIKWVEQKWILGVPEFRVTMKKASFDVPTATMKTQRIVFDTVETKMVPTKTGQYPETVVRECLVDGPFGSKFTSLCTTVRWKDIITDVPQFKKVTTEIKLDLPEFSMTRWSLDIPEIETKIVQQTWLVKIPEVTVRDVTIEAKKLQERGEQLGRRAKNAELRQRGEVDKATANFYYCQAKNMTDQKKVVEVQYSQAVSQLDKAIVQVRAYGIDPTQVKDSEGKVTNLVTKRDELVKASADKGAEIQTAIDKVIADAKKLSPAA